MSQNSANDKSCRNRRRVSHISGAYVVKHAKFSFNRPTLGSRSASFRTVMTQYRISSPNGVGPDARTSSGLVDESRQLTHPRGVCRSAGLRRRGRPLVCAPVPIGSPSSLNRSRNGNPMASSPTCSTKSWPMAWPLGVARGQHHQHPERPPIPHGGSQARCGRRDGSRAPVGTRVPPLGFAGSDRSGFAVSRKQAFHRRVQEAGGSSPRATWKISLA